MNLAPDGRNPEFDQFQLLVLSQILRKSQDILPENWEFPEISSVLEFRIPGIRGIFSEEGAGAPALTFRMIIGVNRRCIFIRSLLVASSSAWLLQFEFISQKRFSLGVFESVTTSPVESTLFFIIPASPPSRLGAIVHYTPYSEPPPPPTLHHLSPNQHLSVEGIFTH